MARLELELDGSGIKRGADLAERELDQVKRSAVQTEAAIDRLAKGGAQDMQRLASGTQRATAAARQLAAAQTQQVGAFGRSRGAIQNTAFQIGDFATQVGAGTAASVALAQQLPQLLGGFGALGAVLGAVVAIGVPLAAAFFNVSDNAEKLSESLDTLSDASKDAVSAAEDLGIAWEDVKGTLADVGAVVQAQNAILALAEVQRTLAEGSRNSFLSGFLDDFTFGLVGAEQGLAGLQERFGLTEAAALDLLLGLERLDGAGPTQAAAEVDKIVRSLIEAKGGVAALDQETIAFILQLVQVQGEAEIVSSLLEEFAPAIDAAAAGTSGLTAGLAAVKREAQDAALALAQAKLNAQSLEGGGRGADPRLFDPRSDRNALARAELEPETRGRARSGGGGRSAASQVDRLAESYQRLRGQLDPAFRAQTQFTEAQQTLNDALAAGKISQQEYNDTLALARQRFEEATQGGSAYARIQEDLNRLQDLGRAGEQAAKQLQQSFADFLFDPFSDGIEGMVRGFADGLRRILSEIISAQITQKIVGLFPGLFGGPAAAGGGGLFAGLFDSGGYIPSGKTGVVAERRPEFVNGALINSPTVLRGPANITGGAATARAAASPQVNQKNVFVFDRSAVAGEVTRDPGFKTAVVDIMRMQGVLNA